MVTNKRRLLVVLILMMAAVVFTTLLAIYLYFPHKKDRILNFTNRKTAEIQLTDRSSQISVGINDSSRIRGILDLRNSTFPGSPIQNLSILITDDDLGFKNVWIIDDRQTTYSSYDLVMNTDGNATVKLNINLSVWKQQGKTDADTQNHLEYLLASALLLRQKSNLTVSPIDIIGKVNKSNSSASFTVQNEY